MGDDGAGALAEALLETPRPALLHLSLSSNRVGDAGCGRLAPLLRRAGPLQTLQLASNLVTDAGVEVLLHAAEHSLALRQLTLQLSQALK